MVSRLFVFDLFLGIGLFLIGLVQQVINAGMIEVCQLDEDTGGNISFSQFITKILPIKHTYSSALAFRLRNCMKSSGR